MRLFDLITDPYINALFVLALGLAISYLILRKYKDNQRLVYYIPHIWTALGVLGTFSVLFLTLSIGSISFDGADLEKTIARLTGAFSTSIVGIIGSLVFAGITKQRLYEMELEAIKNKPYLGQDPRELLYQLKESFISHQSQLNEKLDTLIENSASGVDKAQKTNNILSNELSQLSISIAAIEETITKKFKDTLADFKEVLSQMLTQLGKHAIDESREQITSIYKTLSSSIKEILENQNQLVSSQTEAMQVNYGILDEELRKGRQQTVAETQKTTKTLENGINELSRHYQAEAEEIRIKFEEITKAVASIGKDMQQALDDTLAGRIQELEKTFENINNWQREVKLTLESTLESFSGAVSEYQEVQQYNHETLKIIHHQIKDIEDLRQNQERLIKLLSGYDEQMDEVERRVSAMINLLEKWDRVEIKVTENGSRGAA